LRQFGLVLECVDFDHGDIEPGRHFAHRCLDANGMAVSSRDVQ
jgi:hypothetical protein